MGLKITKIQLAQPVPVFDITVPETERFYADGIIVHNCVEILQNNSESVYNVDTSYEVTGKDISCNLGSTNIALVMAGKNIGKTVATSVRSLTTVADKSDIACVPSVNYGNQTTHAIGLGQMNLHGFLGKERIHYGSPEAIEFIHAYFSTVAYHAYKESCKIAKELDIRFKGFEESKYADGSFLEKYVNRSYAPTLRSVNTLLMKYEFVVPTQEDWWQLIEDIKEHGLYHKYLQAVPPTGSISYINNATSSIHPIVSKIEARKEGRIGLVYYPAPHMTMDNLEYFEDAYEIGYKRLIDTYAAAQEHVDQGLSLTLFFSARRPDGTPTTTKDLNKARIYAWRKNIKTLYYVRIRQDAIEGTDIEGCVACSL